MSGDYPEPKDEAIRVFKNASGDGSALTAEIVSEAATNARLAEQNMLDINVLCDETADDLGLLPDAVRADIREMQQQAQDITVWIQEFAEELETG